MFNIYARSLMTASRINSPKITDVRAAAKAKAQHAKRRRWWQVAPRSVDLSNL